MATKNINRIELLGRAGQDADVSYAASGVAKAKFSLATSRYKKPGVEGYGWKLLEGGDWLEKTEWHNIRALGDIANDMADIRKGNLVHVWGLIENNSWEDKETGEIKYMTTVMVDEWQIETEDRRSNEKTGNGRGADRADRRPQRSNPGTAVRGSRSATRERDTERTSRGSNRNYSKPTSGDVRDQGEITDDDIPF